MEYDKDEAQRALPDNLTTHRGYPVVAVSLFESTGEPLVSYGSNEDGYYSGRLRGGTLADQGVLEAALARLEETPNVPHGGTTYKHMKGGLYEVVAASVHESTGEILVTYRSRLRHSVWTRTLADFGALVPRFKLILEGQGETTS